MRSNCTATGQRGFTLLELMVTLTVVGILAGLSVSAYRRSVIKTNRSEAKTALLRIQVAEEKFFLQNGTYTIALAAAPPAGLGTFTTSQPNGYYTLVVAPNPNTTNAIATSYLVTATATAGGPQLQDIPACQTLTIDDSGVRTPAPAAGCW